MGIDPMSNADVFGSAPRLVNIGDGRRMGVQIQGGGETTVVFEGPGAGYGIDGWADLDKHVAGFATVVTYDRMGVGASEPLLKRYPTATDHADNLAKLLDLLPVKQPVILVGWSWGGLIAQQFSALHPNKVAALLLMDPSSYVHDDSALAVGHMPGALIRFLQTRAMNKMRRGVIAAAKDPDAKAKFIKEMAAAFGPNYPPERRDRDLGLGVDFSLGEAVLDEATARVDALARLGQHFLPTTAEVGRTISERGLPKVPTILLLSTWLGGKPPVSVVKAMAEKFGRYEKTAAELGAEVRKLKDVSHQIPPEAPEACVCAVRDLIERVSAEGRQSQPSVIA
jgi:pimeloyl-ACP methyl ester carboxylesterase